MASWAWVPQQQQQRQLHLTTPPPPHLFCSHPPTTGRRWCGRLWVAQIEDGQGISLPQRSGVRSRTKRQQPITVANGCSSGSRWVAGWQEMYSGWLLPPTHPQTKIATKHKRKAADRQRQEKPSGRDCARAEHWDTHNSGSSWSSRNAVIILCYSAPAGKNKVRPPLILPFCCRPIAHRLLHFGRDDAHALSLVI